jgi:hypothetical protein
MARVGEVTLRRRSRCGFDPGDVDVAEQHAVQPDLGNLARREADDDEAPTLLERPQAVEDAVPADGVEHCVDAAARLRHGLPVLVGKNDLGSARPPSDLRLLRRRHHRDGLDAETGRELECRRSDVAGGAVDEHGLAGLQPAAYDHREVRRVVVEHQRGTLEEVETLRQRHRRRHRGSCYLGPRADVDARRDSIADRERRALRRAADVTGHLAARDEGEIGQVLVTTVGLQHLREGDACRLHIDQDGVAAWPRGCARSGMSTSLRSIDPRGPA